jgi:hypothetical protein
MLAKSEGKCATKKKREVAKGPQQGKSTIFPRKQQR